MFTSSIAIIGAGFSGTLLALNLLHQCPGSVRIRLIERATQFGPGLAYGIDDPDLLLNVPAGRMSAFPDRPTHFLDWLCAQPESETGVVAPDAGTFAPRAVYGRYLRHLVSAARNGEQAGRFELINGEVLSVTEEAHGLRLRLDQDRVLEASVAVVATGNNPLAPIPTLTAEVEQGGFYRHDPWAADTLTGLKADEPVLLIGTGLTTVDCVLRLLRQGHTGPIHLLSRRGLLPCAHGGGAAVPVAATQDMPRRLRALVRFMRAESARVMAAGGTWRAVIDAIRPITQELWQGWSSTERRMFLTHVRPWWDIHRHRMAPAIANRIEDTKASGQTRVHAGRVVAITADAAMAEVTWQPRGTENRSTLRVARVINCTGPSSDITRSADPLCQSLLHLRQARPDPMRLGLDVTAGGALIGADGRVSERLFGVGPICRGALWEITAVPDIRQQCVALGHLIAEMLDEGEPVLAVPPMRHAMADALTA